MPVVQIAASERMAFYYQIDKQGYAEAPNDSDPEGFNIFVSVYITAEEIVETGAQRFFMYEEDEVKAEFPARRRSETVGMVTSIVFHGDDVTLRVGLNSLEAHPGEAVNLAVIKQTITGECVIPIQALHEDYDGSNFVYLVYEEQGPWGKEYVAVKTPVTLRQGSDIYHAVIDRRNTFPAPLIVSSDKPVRDGTKVRFY